MSVENINGSTSLKNEIVNLLVNETDNENLCLVYVCQKLKIHERQLQRKLKSEGTSVRKILNTVKVSRACHLLNNSKLSSCEISKVLGYTDPANFLRAFKRCTGFSPNQYRKRKVKLALAA